MTLTTLHVWERFSQQLRAFIIRRIANPVDADDILQEVFVKIHRNIDTLSNEERLVPWLYQITRNTITDHYRSLRQLVDLPETLVVEDEPAETDRTSQLAAGLRFLIEDLPDKYRQALQLAEFESLTQRELAERLGLSLSGAKSRVQRGRKLLLIALTDCCHFEFDRCGQVIDYTPRANCCVHCNPLPKQRINARDRC